MDTDGVQRFFSNYTGGPGWADKCIQLLKHGDPVDVATGFVTKHGKPFTQRVNESSDIWGINLRTCSKYCSRDILPMQFSFQIFSSGSTNYLLPWLGLCAQLPFETGSPSGNLMSFCLALGSPMLITFSLMSTILNAQLASASIKTLEKSRAYSRDRHPGVLADLQLFERYKDRLHAIYSFLLDAQQVPVRAIQMKGQFSNLLVLPENQKWWLNLRERVAETRRPVTFSLIAQVLFAIIAWIFTVAASYDESLGDPAQALLLSSGSLWMWLTPVILGWVFVGTQSEAHTIEKALRAEQAHFAPRGATQAAPFPGHSSHSGLAITSGLSLPLHPSPTIAIDSTREIPRWFGGDILGDEKNEGPIFNYARIFTWFEVQQIIDKAFRSILDNIQQGNTANIQEIDRWHCDEYGRSEMETDHDAVVNVFSPDGEQTHELQQVSSNRLETERLDPSRSPSDHLRPSLEGSYFPPTSSGSDMLTARLLPDQSPRIPDDISTFCGLGHQDSVKAYPEWNELNSTWKANLAFSIITAIFLQWGTVGAALIISYLTEVRGLGCRSGSYTLYGLLGTFSFALLLASVFLSHQAMLIYQRESLNPNVSYFAFNHHTRTVSHTVICALAVITRIAGKIVVVLNASWIIISSLWELVGFYDSCWCTGTVLGLGKAGWVVLFKTAFELRDEAGPSWAGGIAMGMLVGGIALMVFWQYSRAGIKIRR